jgi:hypothetical protein
MKSMEQMTKTREEWLTKAMNRIIEDVFTPNELRIPPGTKISVAPLPCKPTLPGEKALGTYGVCWYPDRSDAGETQIFINAILGNDDVMDILGTVVHELVHAHVMGEGHESCKHGFPFSKIIRTVGLGGKPKSTTVDEGTELHATLSGIAVELGSYPHAPLRPKAKKVRQSEILTWVSETDPEYTVKAKFSLTQEKGVPRDYNSQPMVPKDPDKFAELEDRTVEEIEEEEAAE